MSLAEDGQPSYTKRLQILERRDLGHTLPFVSALALRRATIDRALREYTTLRTHPAAFRTLALSDPALAAALGLYLAVAR